MKKNKKPRNNNTIHATYKLLLPLGLFFSTLFIYISHLSASVYGGDAGDFLSAISVKGVPHPSGYPLYTILGIIFNALPIQQATAWKVDLLSALLASLTVVIMYGIVTELTRNKFLAVCTSFTLAFLYPFWLYAEITEVSALHNFLMLLVFFLALLYYKRKTIHYIYLLSFCVGLSFSHHEAAVLILPSLLILVFSRELLKPKIILKSVGFFILGLSPYLYVPLAALHNPPINWDNATTLANFLHLITRVDYGWTGKSVIRNSVRLDSLQRYVAYWQSQLPLILLIVVGIGIGALLQKKNIRLLLAIFLAFFLFGPLFFLYGATIIYDSVSFGTLEKFYITSAIFLLIAFPFGIQAIVSNIVLFLARVSPESRSKRYYAVLFQAVFFAIPIFLFTNNFLKTDLHSVMIGDKLGTDILSPLPKDSYVILEEDNLLFNSEYMKYARGVRRDITIPLPNDVENQIDINKKLFRIKTIHPVKNQADHVFALMRDYYQYMVPGNNLFLPYGLLLKYETLKDQKMTENAFFTQQNKMLAGFDHSQYQFPSADSISHFLIISEIPHFYAIAYANTGFYLARHYLDYEAAKPYFEKALTIYPNTDIAHEGLGDYFLYHLNCQRAEKEYINANQINIFNKNVYQKLYNVATTCLHDKNEENKLRTLIEHFPALFKRIKY